MTDPKAEALDAVMVAVSAYTEAALTAGTIRGAPPQMKNRYDAVRAAVRRLIVVELEAIPCGWRQNGDCSKFGLKCPRCARIAELTDREEPTP